MRELLHIADQEIRQGQAREAGGCKSENRQFSRYVLIKSFFRRNNVSPERKFVRAVNPVQAVREVFVVPVEMTGMSGGNTEITANAQRYLRRCRARDRDSQAGDGEGRAADHTREVTIEREDEAVQEGGGDGIRSAAETFWSKICKPYLVVSIVGVSGNRVLSIARIKILGIDATAC